MKKILTLASVVLLGIVNTFAAPKYLYATPADGTTIQSWEIDLKFDISEDVASLKESDPDKEYCVNVPYYTATVYSVDEDGNAVLLRGPQTNFYDPTGAEFKSADVLPIDLKSMFLPLESGKRYRVELEFSAVTAIPGRNAGKAQYWLYDYEETPLVLEYTGGNPLPALTITDMDKQVSPKNGEYVKDFRQARITFDQDIVISDPSGVGVEWTCKNKYSSKVAETHPMVLSIENGNTLVATNIAHEAWKDLICDVYIKEGTVALKDYPDVKNKAFPSIWFRGNKRKVLNVELIYPEQSDIDNLAQMEDRLTIQFDAPADLYWTENDLGFRDAETGEVVLATLSSRNYTTKQINTETIRHTVNWTGGFVKMPGRKISANIDALFEGKFKKSDGLIQTGYYPDENFRMQWEIPSEENMVFDKIKFSSVYNGVPNNTISSGDKLSTLSTVYFVMSPYRMGTADCLSSLRVDSMATLVETTGGMNRLVAQKNLWTVDVSEGMDKRYKVDFAETLYKGHTYKLSLPAKAVACTYKGLQNFLYTEAYEVEIEGDSDFKAIEGFTTNAEGIRSEEMHLYWYVKDEGLEMKPGAKVVETVKRVSDSEAEPVEVSVTEYPLEFVTDPRGILICRLPKTDHGCAQFDYGYEYEYKIEEGVLRDANYPERPCPAITSVITGDFNNGKVNSGESVGVAIEFADDCKVELNGVLGWRARVTSKATNWSLNGSDSRGDAVPGEGNTITYTISENDKLNVVASHISISGTLSTDNPTVGDADGLNAKLEEGKVVISGIAPGTEIRVLSVAGLPVYTHAAKDNTVSIVLPEGVYIVIVGEAAWRVEI